MLVIGLVLIVALLFSYKDANTAIPCVALLISAAALYYLFSKAKRVEFDEHHLIISSKTHTEVVPLASVLTIKLTMTQINNDNFWKIKYIGNDGTKRAVRILPNRENFEVFKNAVQLKNPQVKIRSWSHSFDLDQ